MQASLPAVPRPQHVDLNEETVRFEDGLTITTADEDRCREEAERLRKLIEREVGTSFINSTSDDTVQLSMGEPIDGSNGHPEAYRLEISNGGVSLAAPTGTGLHYGAKTLVTILDLEAGDLLLPAGEIRDWPMTEWRGMLVDPARGFIPPQRLEELIDHMARAKMNRLHLHLADAEAYTLESNHYPELSGGFDEDEEIPADFNWLQSTVKRQEWYSTEEIEQLHEYADDRDVELIPEIDIPGHATQLLMADSRLRCQVDDGEPSMWTLCAGAEHTYEFLETILGEVARQFDSEIVHIGTDEWEFEFSWEDCQVCHQRMEEEGLDDIHELFVYFLNRLHGILDDHGKRMMIWNETIDSSVLSDVPTDVLIQFWRYSPQSWGVFDGVSMEEYLEAGFEIVNSYVPAAYIDRHTTEDYLLGWNPRRRPTVPSGYEDQVLGGEMTAWSGWEDESWREYYRRALPSAIPSFGNQVWNGQAVEDREAFGRAVTRHVLGPCVPGEFNIYDTLGGVILPVDSDRNEEMVHVHEAINGYSIPEAIDHYDNVQQTLSELGDQCVHPDVPEVYDDCLEWLTEVAERDGRGIIERP